MKVFVFYASSGAGHQKAAEAIGKALKARSGISYQVLNSLDYMTPIFKYVYPRMYLFLVKYLPSAWGFCFFTLNLPWLRNLIRISRRVLNTLHGRRFEQFLLTEKPDVVISTHFLAGEIISSLKRKALFSGRLITVVTDFVPHFVWDAPSTDQYIVGSEEGKETLIRRGVAPEKISLLGIPVDPLYEEVVDRKILSEKLGISPNFFTIFVVSGGFGVGPIEELVSFFSKKGPLQLLVVCGHNRALYQRLKKQSEGNSQIKLYQFVDNIHELMSVSDCMVSKSGGLMMSEALAKKLPTFILHPIPGQEVGNRDVLLRHHAALSVENVRALESYFSNLEELKQQLEKVRKGIETFSKPKAAAQIAHRI